jgi:hypothetical protein
MTRLPREYFESLERRLRELTPLVAEVVPEALGDYEEYLHHGEYGLAVETVAELLPEGEVSEPCRKLAAGLLAEARVMRLERVEQWLRD